MLTLLHVRTVETDVFPLNMSPEVEAEDRLVNVSTLVCSLMLPLFQSRTLCGMHTSTVSPVPITFYIETDVETDVVGFRDFSLHFVTLRGRTGINVPRQFAHHL